MRIIMLAILLAAVSPFALAGRQSDDVRQTARVCVDSFVIQGHYLHISREDRDICEHAGTAFAVDVLGKLKESLREPLATFVDLCLEDFVEDPHDRDYFSRKDAHRYGVPILEKSDFCRIQYHLYYGGRAYKTVSLKSVLWAIASKDLLTDGLTAFKGRLYEWDPSDPKAIEKRRSAIEERERVIADDYWACDTNGFCIIP